MQVIRTAIPDVLLLDPKVFADDRGVFYESYNKRAFRSATGLDVEFVQDNHSRSKRNVLRGLHYQVKQAQGKLIRVVFGEVFDVAVDLRRTSPTFGRWVGFHLSAESRRMAWIPPGFAHGFVVTSESADFLYKATEFYAPEYERSILWNDSDLAIAWPVQGAPIVAPKDAGGQRFRSAELE